MKPRHPHAGRSAAWWPLALFAFFGSVACGDADKVANPREKGSSALLITLDTTRADALSCLGGPLGLTPALDALAAESVIYENAHTVAPLTTPSHASMLTGLYPPRHSVRDNDIWLLPQEVDTLAELAGERGIQTGAVIAALVMHERFGLDQGFDTYSRPEMARSSGGSHVHDQRDAKATVDAAVQWLEERDPDRAFFLWVHFFDPHVPYEPPAEFRGGMAVKDPYHGEVAYMDAEIGRLMEHLRRGGILDETVVLVVGDHGESLGQHGELTHGTLAYETTLRVPFLLRYPDGFGAGTRSSELVSVVDVFPTLLDALGVSTPAGVDGLNLHRGSVPTDRGVYFESYAGYLGFGYSPLVGWMDGEGKYLHSPRPELYDIAEDPTEITNVVGERPELVQRYRAALGALEAKPAVQRTSGASSFPELRSALRGLGYAALGGSSAEFPSFAEIAELDLVNPAAATEIHEATLDAKELVAQGRYVEAEKMLADVLSVIEANPCALHYLAISLINQQRQEEAVEPLRRLLALRPELGFAHLHLAMCLWKAEELEQAWKHMESALNLEPDNVDVLANAVGLLLALGREQEAQILDQRVRQLDTEGRYAGKDAPR